MQTEAPSILPPPDEINLVRVFVRTIDFFINHIKVFILFSLIGLGAGFGYYKFKRPVYESRFTGECMSIPDARTVELINDLEKLRSNEDWKELGQRLGMSTQKVQKIKKLETLASIAIDKEAKGIDDYLLPTTEVSYRFSVVAKIYDNAILPDLQKGIIEYLSGNEYSRIRVERFVENRKNLLKAIDSELKKLDSLNLLFASKQLITGNNGNLSMVGPGDFKAMVIHLTEKRLSVEDELRFAAPVRVFQGFTAFRNPVEPSLRLSLMLGFLGALVLALVLIMVKNLARVYLGNRHLMD
jgi:hypothetical protein